jgi:hypothetical protein
MEPRYNIDKSEADQVGQKVIVGLYIILFRPKVRPLIYYLRIRFSRITVLLYFITGQIVPPRRLEQNILAMY